MTQPAASPAQKRMEAIRTRAARASRDVTMVAADGEIRLISGEFDLIRIPADAPEPRQKLMFNAGIYAFRRGLGFPEMYGDLTERLIRAGVAYGQGAYWHNEQHALMFAMLRLGLKWRELSRAENHMIFPSQIDGDLATPPCTHARLIHYGRSLSEPHRGRFLERLRRERPEVHEWLSRLAPIADEKYPKEPLAFVRKAYRNLHSRRQSRRSIRAVDEWKARQSRADAGKAAE